MCYWVESPVTVSGYHDHVCSKLSSSENRRQHHILPPWSSLAKHMLCLGRREVGTHSAVLLGMRVYFCPSTLLGDGERWYLCLLNTIMHLQMRKERFQDMEHCNLFTALCQRASNTRSSAPCTFVKPLLLFPASRFLETFLPGKFVPAW